MLSKKGLEFVAAVLEEIQVYQVIYLALPGTLKPNISNCILLTHGIQSHLALGRPLPGGLTYWSKRRTPTISPLPLGLLIFSPTPRCVGKSLAPWVSGFENRAALVPLLKKKKTLFFREVWIYRKIELKVQRGLILHPPQFMPQFPLLLTSCVNVIHLEQLVN